jgi:acetoin utilization protein AcuB
MDPRKAIRKIMTTRLVTIGPETNAQAIQEIFEKNDFHHLPVVERGDQLVGIISKEDFFKVAYVLSLNTAGRTYSEKQYDSLKARDFMTTYPVFLDPDDSVGLAADIFLANKFHALPIVEDGALIGLVTTHDLLTFSFNHPIVEKETGTYEEI